MSGIYGLVKTYLKEGRAPSRNQAFDRYGEPQFAQALRIYRHLHTLQQDLRLLSKKTSGTGIDIQWPKAPHERICVRYEIRQMKRTAFLSEEEWKLLTDDPAISSILKRPRTDALNKLSTCK